MGVNYTQTDTFGSSLQSWCSGASVFSADSKVAQDGATAGSASDSVNVSSSAVSELDLGFEITPASGTTWGSGTWTVRLNVTTANMNVTWVAVYICQVDSGDTNKATIGSTTGLSISLGTTGVKSTTVSGSAVTPAANDKVQIVLLFSNGAMSTSTWSQTPNQNIDSPFTASSNKTLAASGGSYTLTGTAATPKLGRNTAAGAGSYAITGTAATPRKGQVVAAGVGSYALTGTAATTLHAWRPSATAGSYTFTGTAASPRRNLPLIAGSGSYLLTGTAASPLHAWKPTAGAGAYALTGTAASPLHGWKVAAGAGSYALTGTDASLRRGLSLPATGGSYALTGTSASLLHAWRVSAGSGSYALTGTDATLTKSTLGTFSLSAGAGSYALTGTAATLRHVWVVSTGVGSYSLTGTAATPRRGLVAAANSGSYALTGSSASALLKRILSADNGIYLLTGSGATPTIFGSAVQARAPEGGDGKPRRRIRTAEDELTEGEIQWMQRKLQELKNAKTEREKAEAAKALEIALAQAAQDDKAAEVISAAIQERRPEAVLRADYGPVMHDVALLTSITSQLASIVKQAAAEHKRMMDDEDDIEMLLL